MVSLPRQLVAEMFGTFALVFAGTGAIVSNEISQGSVTHVGIALTFGLVVLAMIYALGDVSGCHINPAVSIAFGFVQQMPAPKVLAYIIAQCSGAILASVLLRMMFPQASTLGETLPAQGAWQAFVLEWVLTLILMFVILSVFSGAKETGLMAGVAIAAVVGLEALFAGPISGASMNPARSLAPALVSGRWEHLWVYMSAPVLGSLSGAALCLFVRRQP